MRWDSAVNFEWGWGSPDPTLAADYFSARWTGSYSLTAGTYPDVAVINFQDAGWYKVWVDEGKDTIGNKPSHMGVWEKFQLGWLNYEVARAGQKSEHKLGPMEFNTKQAQGLFVVLPKKSVTTQIGTPFAGSQFYYSGAGDNLDNSMTKSFTETK